MTSAPGVSRVFDFQPAHHRAQVGFLLLFGSNQPRIEPFCCNRCTIPEWPRLNTKPWRPRAIYTSVHGAEEGTAFSPIIQGNQETEAVIRENGLPWVTGRSAMHLVV